MALSVTMDFAPCSNALRFTALCVHFVLFTMGFTRPCAKQRKKRMEAKTMLGSCCIHDRPDIDTYLAYLDMYTDSYIHIYIYIFINSRQSEISRPTGKHISDTAATVELSCKACFLTLLCGGLSSPDHPAPDPTPDPTPSLA